MWEFRTAQEFIEQAKRATDIDDLARSFGKIVRNMGFDQFTCVSHVDFSDPPDNAVGIVEFPQAWVDRYTGEHYERHDRVLAVASGTDLPFTWDQDNVRKGLTAKQRLVFDEAAEVDIRHGFTVPVHARGALPASVNMVGPSPGIDPKSGNALHLMGVYLHDAALRILAGKQGDSRKCRPHLTARECECLKWAAVGKTDWEISRILTISERTAHFHIENAKSKFGVPTRIQAVVRAFMENRIFPD